KTTPPKSSILDNLKEIKKLDRSNTLGSIEALADQVKHAWEEAQQVKFQPQTELKNVVVAGMGGSALGPDVVKHLFKTELKLPFEVINSYSLPGYVNEHSLVILASYSGTTEEVLSAAQQVISKKAQVMVICAGGKLAELADKHHWPKYLINPKHNPSNQPRMAIGYAIFGLISLLSKAQVINLTNQQVEEVVQTIIQQNERCQVQIKTEQNPAKTMAFACLNRRPILVAAEFLTGAAHTATNQFNENAKIFADYKIIPEINHHLMEGLKFPNTNEQSHYWLFLNSQLYHPRNQKRFKLTQQVVEQNQIETLAISLTAESKLTQVFETITLFAYTNFYLAMLEDIDPAPIPFVNWFKKKLK
ncbi:MAG: SIS domain-containing protein, partial [Candidatus Pacebacteria bacterium]|nr:SIS domain-containing protein [Candidatus Paceibacterota bacterium]